MFKKLLYLTIVFAMLLTPVSNVFAAPVGPNALPQCEAQPFLKDVTLMNGPEIKAKAAAKRRRTANTQNHHLPSTDRDIPSNS